MRQQASDGTSDPNAPDDPAAPGDPSQPTDPGAAPNAVDPAGSPTDLTVDMIDRDLFRGLPMRIRGRARAGGDECAHLRVDVVMVVEGETGERRLGSLSTDDRGVFDGAIVLPPDLPIGDHELLVTTAGAGSCGPGQTL
jgi:hypothetical protein